RTVCYTLSLHDALPISAFRVRRARAVSRGNGMSNPQYGFNELAAAQAQPEVTVNLMVRMISQAVAGEIVIDFASDADYELDASKDRKSTRLNSSHVKIS